MRDINVFSGINPRARIERLPYEEKIIVKNLAKEFYITMGCKDLHIGQSEYRYIFLKLPDSKRALYGVQNEIMVLFSPFENFEPRTLDAIERIQEENQGYRLDKICAFVISKDNSFAEKIDRTIKSTKESRIITPFTYDELSISQESNFYRANCKTMMEISRYTLNY
jgi:hypothetical protein